MKSSWKKVLVLASAVALCLSADDLMAQNRQNGGGNGGGGGGNGGGFGGRRNGGNFDPAQARQMQMDNYKERLEVTDDAEWKVLEAAITKVLDAQQELRQAEFAAGGRGGRGRRGNNNNADTTGGGGGGNQGGGPGGRGFTPSPEMQALQRAIDDKAPADEIKAKLTAVRESVKAKETKVDTARKDLQRLLSTRQEGIAVTMGLLR